MEPKKPNDHSLPRRKFLETSGLGVATAALSTIAAPSIARGAEPTSDPVRLGHIGLGVRGGQLAKYTGAIDSAKVVAVCDVYKPHLQRGVEASNQPDVKSYLDYRDLLADPRVEAVVIATPDHWHERMLIDAAEAGKDVYCEKGWTTSVGAAKRMRAAVRKNKVVMQLGHQGRQFPSATEAGKLIRDGLLGAVTMVHTGRYFNGTRERPAYRWYGWYTNHDRPDPDQVFRDLHWERWLGSAPKIEWNDLRFWHWRCYWDYGTGQAGDLLSHELDYVQSVLGYGIPDTCMCAGLNAFYKDGREVPDTWLATYQFKQHDCTVHFEGVQNSERLQPPEFCGKKGRMIFNGIGQDAARFEVYEDGSAWTQYSDARPEPIFNFDPSKVPEQRSHMEDFLHCVRTREKCRCNEDEAFIEAATLIMSVKSYFEKRMVRWDKKKEDIV